MTPAQRAARALHPVGAVAARDRADRFAESFIDGAHARPHGGAACITALSDDGPRLLC
jgi:hypothetical protein